MTKIRRLKKDVKSLAADLMTECEIYLKFHPETDRKKLDKITEGLKKNLDSLIFEINHARTAESVKPKAYYRKVADKVGRDLIALLDKIEELPKE